jgi:glycine hydroxymethyltransferase
MSHIAGLVAGGVHMNPVPYADIVTTTTHKTLRGPRGGLILCKEEFIDRINDAVFPGIQGGPLEHIVAAKAVCFREAAEDRFKTYTRNVVKNAKALAEALAQEGFDLVTGGTDNHMVLADLQSFGVPAHELQNKMDDNYITLNGLSLPGSLTGGIRVGTPAVTTRGMGEEEMKEIAKCIALTARDFAGTTDEVKAIVKVLCEKFPLYA